MLAHEFISMPAKSVGDTPLLTTMELRCKYCMKPESKARQDGCPAHELEEKGSILLAKFNPGGVEYFKGRDCVTCGAPIMVHYLRKGSSNYWCFETLDQFSEGITDCICELNGVVAPDEQNRALVFDPVTEAITVKKSSGDGNGK